jgi:PadR family transcriptional regulator PadR
MTRVDSGSLYGTVNLLILKTLSDDGPTHGLGVARRIQRSSGEALQIEEGALYPALQRLERDGLLASRWGTSDQNRRAKFYDLTPKGRKRLARELDAWLRQTRAICEVLGVTWTAGTT